MKSSEEWVPTPTFLYRNYLYKKLTEKYSSNKNFLLIGTGSGYFLQWLADKNFKGTGIDISKESIKISKHLLEKEKNITLKMADLFKYKASRRYDLIFCFEVIEHIKEDKEALKKIFKLLNPGGTLLISVPAHMSEWAKMDEIGGHFRRYEKKDLKNMLEDVGFKIKKFWSYGFPFLKIIRWVSKSGGFVKNFNHRKENNMNKKTKKSGIRTEYDPRLKFLVANSIILNPLFSFMDLFLDTDFGLGYLVEAKKPLK